MSALENPTTRINAEEPVQGYREIGKMAGLSKSEAWRAAEENEDPLPCWKYRGKVLAWPSAIREWVARQMMPVKLERKLRRQETGGTAGTIETDVDDMP